MITWACKWRRDRKYKKKHVEGKKERERDKISQWTQQIQVQVEQGCAECSWVQKSQQGWDTGQFHSAGIQRGGKWGEEEERRGAMQ